jgi:hypothetical protein
MEFCTGLMRSSTQKIILFSGPGTRRWPRFRISEVPSITGVSSNAGSRIKVVNISRGGALLQTNERAAPHTKIQLNFATSEGVIQLTGFVLRSSVSSPKGMPQFQAAVAFDRPLRVFDEPQEPTASMPQSGEFSSGSIELLYKPTEDEESAMIPAFLAIHFCKDKDFAQDETFKLNDW